METSNNNEKRPSAPVGLITGSGTYVLEGLEDARPLLVETEHGCARVTTGRMGGVEIAHISRHGNRHPRLSHQVEHRANIAALALLEARCIVATTICGAVKPGLRLGELILFDDFYFPSNRLPDGSVCTFHTEPGDPRRAHWIFERPYSPEMREAIARAARRLGHPMLERGCYGHVDGPRFNTRAEIRALAALGVAAVSQTAGPETVLAGETGIPMALLGCVTDYANGTAFRPTSVEELMLNMGESSHVFKAVLMESLPALGAGRFPGAGCSYGFERSPGLYRAPEPAL